MMEGRLRSLLVLVATAYPCMASPIFGSSIDGDGVEQRDAAGIDFFEKRIAPILERRCYSCHSHDSGKAKGGLVLDSREGWSKGGSEGPAIVPGKPDQSLVIQAVRYEGLEMPPRKKLPHDEIALLEEWVELGAPDPRSSKATEIDPAKLWALEPIVQPDLPAVTAKDWPRDDLDSFVLAALEREGLTAAGDADRYTLLRRVTFDLTGLPPTPEEIDAFSKDSSDGAYERVVDRLLKSPGFGDHWARHWFDLSCYADLADIQGNTLIRDAWRYRDYVIAALNADERLDRFIHEQIAGDLMPYENAAQRRKQLIATGFLAIGPWTLQNYIKPQLDADVVDHQIDRIGRTFLGQTLSCARCHDHKFDPVPTRDYYALAGIFHSTRTTSYDGPGVWSQITHVTLPAPLEAAAEFERLSREIDAERGRLRKERDELRRQEEKGGFLRKILGDQANSLTMDVGVAANEADRKYRVSFAAGPSTWAAAGQATADGDGLLIQVLREDETVLAYHVHHPRPWSGKADAQRLAPGSFTYVGDGSGDVRLHLTASAFTGRFGGALDDLSIADSETSTVLFEENFDAGRDGGIRGKQAGTGWTVLAKCSFPGWRGGGINHSHAVELAQRGTPSGVGEPNLALQIYSGPPVVSTNPRVAAIERELEALSRKLDASRPDRARALAVEDVEKPGDSPIYRRGSFQSLGAAVPRGFLSAVKVSRSYEIPEGTSGRLQLARWLTDEQNPLTSRVLVNRIWHHLFGNGLVRSVDYFGVHGERPSHPELLDFLALRFRREDRWSLKRTVRRMVLSRTYRMASTHSARAAALDPDNRLLWRMPRRRLGAESIRDAILSASGELDPGRGGSPLGLELKGNIQGLGGNVNPPTWAGKIADYIRYRRSVYLPLRRERPTGDLEILSVFDFPHPNDITGARPNTTVAPQALFLLNAPFVRQQADKLARRLAKLEPGDERERIVKLYLLTISRPPNTQEIDGAMTFLDRCRHAFAEHGDSQDARARAWHELCHALLASNSFLFRE